MPLTDTTNKNGLLQTVEFWTNLGDAGVTGDATLKKIIVARLNSAFDRIMPLLLSFSDNMRWDDQNNTDHPIGTISLVSGQSDYTIATDADGLNILNITDVQILPSATATYYYPLRKITLDDYYSLRAMSPNPSDIGVPFGYVEKGNTIFLFPQPNYSIAAGIKIFFERDHYYFLGDGTDDTKKPGIPRPFHEILAIYAAYDWVLVNKSSETALITRLEAQIKRREQELFDMIGTRNPTHNIISPRAIGFR